MLEFGHNCNWIYIERMNDLFLLYSTSNYYFYTTLVIVWSRKNVPQFSGVAKQIFLGGINFNRED